MTMEKMPIRAEKSDELVSHPALVGIAKGSITAVGSASRTGGLRKVGNHLVFLTFLLLVALPLALGSYYIVVVASERYVSGSGFSIRGIDAGPSFDGLGALTGLASAGSTTSDSYIVLEYLKSRDLVERLRSEIDFASAYGYEDIDFYSRIDPDSPIEDLVKYWDRKIATSFDSTSGIITFEVQAFRAKDAKKIASLVFENTQRLVNEISERARQDSVRFAAEEVKLSEERQRAAIQNLREFREQERSIDPAISAELDLELISALEARLINIRARIAAIGDSLDANAPSLSSMRRQAEAIQDQIQERTSEIRKRRGKEGSGISNLLAKYESLIVEKEFAQQSHIVALTSLENARIESDRQQRYLAVYSRPALAERATYPRKIISILVLGFGLICAWGIGALITFAVRDHLL